MGEDQVLAGRYEVVRELARGGMGKVLLVRDRVLDRELAVKTLLAKDAVERQLRFVEEAQVTGQLVHPNIVPVHELGSSGGELFLAMKRVEGRDLKDVVHGLAQGDAKTLRRFPLARLLRLFLKVCEAMAFAHERGVIHRDLKPANVMVGRGDEVLVMDWGLAKPVGSPAGSPGGRAVVSKARDLSATGGDQSGLTMEGAVVGTPAYMPPEQAEGEGEVDLSADVYSLGATLYELLALRPPYQGGNLQVLTALFKAPPPPPRAVAKHEVPPALEGIVLRAMARAPADRYADAAALARDVEAYLDGRSVSAHREGFAEAMGRLARRHKAVLISLLAAALLVFAAGVAFQQAVAEQTRQAESEVARAKQALAGARAAEAEAEEAKRFAAQTQAETDRLIEELRPARDAVEAVGQAVVFAGMARRPVKIAHLIKAHRDLRADLDAPLGAPAEDREPSTADEILERLRGRLPEIRARVDELLGRALVSRDPVELIRRQGRLKLGAARPLLLARAHLRLGRRGKALEELAKLKPSDEGQARAARALQLLLERAPLVEQERAFGAAIEARPSDAWLYMRRGEIRCRRAGARVFEVDSERVDVYQEARADYDAALRLDRLDPMALLSYVDRFEGAQATKLGGYGDLLGRRAGVSTETNALFHVMRGCRRFWGSKSGKQFERWPDDAWENLTKTVTHYRSQIESGALALPYAQVRVPFGRAHLLLGRWEKALWVAQDVLGREPHDVTAAALAADALCRLGRLREAEALAREHLERDPENGALAFALGESLRRQGRYAEAAPFLQRGAEESRGPELWLRLAQCLERLEDPAAWGKGVIAARRALALDPVDHLHEPRVIFYPNEPELHRTLGKLRRRQGKLGAALLHFARAFNQSRSPRIVRNLEQLTPEELKLRGRRPLDLQDGLLLGEVLEALGLEREAALAYQQVCQDGVLEPEAQGRLERLKAKGVDLPRATTQGRGARTKVAQASALLKARRVTEALALLDEAVGESPADARAVGLRGQARIMAKDYAGAEDDLARALKLGASPPAPVTANLGVARLAQRKLKEAREAFARALELDPNLSGADQIRTYIRQIDAKLGPR